MRRWKRTEPRSARGAPMMARDSKEEGESTAIDGLHRCSSTAALTTPTRPAVRDCSRPRTRPHRRPEMRRRIRAAASIRRRRRSTSPAKRYHRSPRRALPRCPPRPLRTRGTRLYRAHTLRHTRYARRRAAAKS